MTIITFITALNLFKTDNLGTICEHENKNALF